MLDVNILLFNFNFVKCFDKNKRTLFTAPDCYRETFDLFEFLPKIMVLYLDKFGSLSACLFEFLTMKILCRLIRRAINCRHPTCLQIKNLIPFNRMSINKICVLILNKQLIVMPSENKNILAFEAAANLNLFFKSTF